MAARPPAYATRAAGKLDHDPESKNRVSESDVYFSENHAQAMR